MRPQKLYPYFSDLSTLQGIGPRLLAGFQRLCAREHSGVRLIDLAFHLPRASIDRRPVQTLTPERLNTVVTIHFTAQQHHPGRVRGHPWRIEGLCADATPITLVFFRAQGSYLQRLLPVDKVRIVSGKLESWKGQWQIAHPDRILNPARESLPAFEPVYPLVQAVPPQTFAKVIAQVLGTLEPLDEWHSPDLLQQEGWPDFHSALHQAHRPEEAFSLHAPHRRRLAFDELLAHHLALEMVRTHRKAGHSLQGDGRYRTPFLKALPFSLTSEQNAAAAEILDSMSQPVRMLRLLQGDVGSGKTVVASLAMLAAIEAGGQAVLLVPTEILAQQHGATLGAWLLPLGLNVVVLTGRHRGRERAAILQKLQTGHAHIAIGTHALFQDDVAFKALTLIVIDEQHRFGVFQRLAMSQKGNNPDLLVMTATPIPRTLMLATFGDVDQTRMTGKPPGRPDVDTVVLGEHRMDTVIQRLRSPMEQGARVYWVCPLIAGDEEAGQAGALERFKAMAKVFGASNVGMVHGKMKPQERDSVLEAFAHGSLKMLVATTVIEVGLDIPEATIMVIEQAESFGLAQLHQLRGRIGRGQHKSFCLLLYRKLEGPARERLNIMRESEDGFVIAEKDLALRGGGEVLGARQSGLPEFRLANMEAHHSLIPLAFEAARALLAQDPRLQSPRGRAVRTLLYVFEREAMIHTVLSA